MRWHVRAYCEKNRGSRDFVLSRLRGIPELRDDETHNDIAGDDDWNKRVAIIIKPDERLSFAQKDIIQTDFGLSWPISATRLDSDAVRKKADRSPDA